MPWYLIIHLTVMGLGIITGAFRFSLLSMSVRYFYALLFISFLTDIVAWYIGQKYGSNLIISHFFIVIQYILIALAYKQELMRYKRWVIYSILVLMGISLTNTVLKYETAFVEYPSTVRMSSNIFIISWSLLYLRALLNNSEQFFTQYPLFWISIGWLLFVSITFFSLGSFNIINISADYLKELFRYLRITANFALYILFLIAILSKQKTLFIR